MAITEPTLTGPGLMPLSRSGPWAINDDQTDDASGSIEIKGAPGPGYSLYLTHVTMSGRLADVAITLEDSAGLDVYGPIQMQVDGGANFTKDWEFPLKLPSGLALHVDASADQDFTVYVEGFTGKDVVT